MTFDQYRALLRPRPQSPRPVPGPDRLEGDRAGGIGSTYAEVRAARVDADLAAPVGPEDLWVPPGHPLEPVHRLVDDTSGPDTNGDHLGANEDSDPFHGYESLAARARAAIPKAPFFDIEGLLVTYPKRRSVLPLWTVSLLFGWFGIDRFMTGRWATGILKLLTFGGAGLWWAVDLFSIAAGNVTDPKGVRYSSPLKVTAAAAAASALAVGLVASVVPPILEPYAHEAVRNVQEALAPAPPPPPTWQTVLPNSNGTGDGSTQRFTTHGGQVQLGAQSDGLAYFWVEPDGKDETKDGTKPTVSITASGATTKLLDLPAGTYRVAVASQGGVHWMAFATELTPATR